MIIIFKQKELCRFFNTGHARIPAPAHRRRVMLVLDLLQAATRAEDMNFPGSGFHRLEPPTASRYAVSVDANWRICFVFRDGDAYEVEYTDYH